MSILHLLCSYTCIGQGLGMRLPLALTDECGRTAETAKQSENTEAQRPFKSDVRVLRTCLVDLHTCSSGCSLPSARGFICACIYLVTTL